jgi:hypothetical protein
MGLRLQSWLASIIFHAILAGLVVFLFLEKPSPALTPIKIRLAEATHSAKNLSAVKEFLDRPQNPPTSKQTLKTQPPSAPRRPTWQSLLPLVKRKSLTDKPIWTSKELLKPNDKQEAPGSSLIWELKGELTQNQPLPLPPPSHLVPLGGQKWSLSLTIAGVGGPYLTVEGADSGRPDLDRWLGDYLKTMMFPPSPDQKNYTVRWTVRLKTGRPE